MRKLLLTILMLITVGALAAPSTVVITVQEPITNDDMSILDDLAFYQGFCSTTQGGPYNAMNTIPAPAPAPLVGSIIDLTINNCLTTQYGTAYFVMTAIDLSTLASDYSNEVSVSFLDQSQPAAPVISIDLTKQ